MNDNPPIEIKGLTDSFLILVVDRWAARNAIVKELRAVLRKHGVPARPVDPRILSALQLRREQALSFREAARRVFGDANCESRLRYWDARLGVIV
jgi:hypothetical protein